jgi:NAD(P)-dependent dehydrogenase (short-subunit alcohol dehydrogenase family)
MKKKMQKNQMKNKNIIITGANTGIGYETALDLAKQGARVILACRDAKKANEACSKIKEQSQNDKVEVELIDLSKLKSIKEFADRIKLKLSRLDVLINNAGLVQNYYSKTEDGLETSFGVNYIGPYYLTRLLLDLLKKSAPSRIINVSSVGHKGVKLRWDNLQSEKFFFSFQQYLHTKLMNVLFTNELARRLKDSGVIAVSLHPGVVSTDIMRLDENTSYLMRFINGWAWAYFKLFGLSAYQGSRTSVYCATNNDVLNHNGGYYEFVLFF